MAVTQNLILLLAQNLLMAMAQNLLLLLFDYLLDYPYSSSFSSFS